MLRFPIKIKSGIAPSEIKAYFSLRDISLLTSQSRYHWASESEKWNPFFMHFLRASKRV